MNKNKWSLKKIEELEGKIYLKREEDGFAFANPQFYFGRVKQVDGRTVAITEKRNKVPFKVPSLEIKFLRWHGIEGTKPLFPEALDGKRVKITIEVLP